MVRADTDPLPGPDGWAAVLVLGGPQSMAAPPPYLVAERELVRHLVTGGVPYLGLCLGGQLLASAFAASVRPAGQVRYGFRTLQLGPVGRTDPLFRGLPDRLATFCWNSEQFDLPAGAA